MARIVVVDDEYDHREILSVLLTFEGHNVQTYGSGEEFLAEFRAESQDLILLDICLPTTDGYEIFDRAREVDRRVPIVAVTAYAFCSDNERLLAHGFTAHITKPILDPEAFIDTVRKTALPTALLRAS